MTWTLIYAHDEGGAPVMGEKADLVRAAENGAAIRVAVLGEVNGTPKTHIYHANPVMVAHGHVHAQLLLEAAYNFITSNEVLDINPEASGFVMNVSTAGIWKGRHLYSERRLGGEGLEGRTALKWFADL